LLSERDYPNMDAIFRDLQVNIAKEDMPYITKVHIEASPRRNFNNRRRFNGHRSY